MQGKFMRGKERRAAWASRGSPASMDVGRDGSPSFATSSAARRRGSASSRSFAHISMRPSARGRGRRHADRSARPNGKGGRGPERLVRPLLGGRQSSVFSIPARTRRCEAGLSRRLRSGARRIRTAAQGLQAGLPSLPEDPRDRRAAATRRGRCARASRIASELAFWRMNGERALADAEKAAIAESIREGSSFAGGSCVARDCRRVLVTQIAVRAARRSTISSTRSRCPWSPSGSCAAQARCLSRSAGARWASGCRSRSGLEPAAARLRQGRDPPSQACTSRHPDARSRGARADRSSHPPHAGAMALCARRPSASTPTSC